MKSAIKTMATILCFAFVSLFTVSAFASDIQLFSNNVSTTVTSFSISSSGKATVTNRYVGNGKTTGAKIVTKVQKKVGLIWVTVSDGKWTDTSSATSYSKSHSVQLSSSGTYRAHVVFTISGTGGANDEITKNVQKTYS